MLDAVTTGTSGWVPIEGGPKDLTFWATSTGTTSGGTVLIQETDDVSSAATPSTLATVTASDFTGGKKQATHSRIGSGVYVRATVSATITGGGTVTIAVTGI